MKWRCPICRTFTDSESIPDFPFCSERCRLIDLGNWSSEKYKISEPVIDESLPEESPWPSPDRGGSLENMRRSDRSEYPTDGSQTTKRDVHDEKD